MAAGRGVLRTDVPSSHQYLFDDLTFALEVQIERPLRDAYSPHYVGDARRVITALGEASKRRAQDLTPSLLLATLEARQLFGHVVRVPPRLRCSSALK